MTYYCSVARKKKTIEDFPYGMCMVSSAPLRAKPDDRAEMVSQLLFGEQVQILRIKAKNWLKVRCLWDDYEGWLDPKQIIRLSAEDSQKYTLNVHRTLEIEQPILSDQRAQSILLGSSLPDFDGISFKFPSKKYVYSGQVINPENTLITIEIFIKIIRKYLYAPYLWGGRSPFGLDCSGYTQVVYALCNVKLPRDACDQVKVGETVDFVASAQLGDLAYFENNDEKIIHVGIVLDDGLIIHASGQVRIDKLDHYGIYNNEIKKYSHKLRIIKRVLNLDPGAIKTESDRTG